MDEIARNANGFDSDLSDALAGVVTSVVLGLAAVLALALGAEILRRADLAAGAVRALDRILPASARTVAAASLSLWITLLGPASASASDAPVRDWLSGTTTTTSPVATEEGLVERTIPSTAAPSPSTSRPAALSQVPPVSPVPPHAPGLDEVAVVAGDCLWSIAARRLGPGAANVEIDRAWRAIYALNLDVIGNDPDLIFPGVLLSLPPIDSSPVTSP